MDAYPPEYALHNLPLVALSGLDTTEERDPPLPVQDVLPGRATTTVTSDLPPVTGERAQQLLREFQSADASNAPWNGRGLNRRGNLLGFRIRTVGREFKFPPKKADAPSQSVTTPPSSPTIAPSWILHSPISPLSPSSETFPDGLIAPSWISKHQYYVPSMFISFFAFGSDETRNTLNDNQLKTEINKIRAQIQKSEYRTRFAVVLVGERSLLEAPIHETDERLANIRRATGLDPKTSLFLLIPGTSRVELRAFVVTVLSSLQPACIEYYRDLTKHARRKKARGTVPSPTAPPTRGASHPLTQNGWGVRYDFKLGIFAEFRQEMDTAQRHYESALDALFGSDGIFETTASWSPRWDETRLLADAIALRRIRCQLWNLYTTSAVQSWLRYKEKMQDLVDRRGKGSSNYGWEAWESRWAEIMAQLIQRAELPAFNVSRPISEADPLVSPVPTIFLPADKTITIGERLQPWEYLHHAGYWHKLAAEHARKRFVLAREIPEEDRTSPGMSPATKVVQRNQMYDVYLVPEPHLEMPLGDTAEGVEHWRDIVKKLSEAVPQFQARGQARKVEQLHFEISRTLLQARQYDDAFKVLRPLWETMSWRREGWWDIASEVLWALHECALRVQDPETYVLTEWELYSPAFAAKSRYRHDLMSCLDAFPEDNDSGKPSLSINANDFKSCLSVTFTFVADEGNVGEPLHAQIAVTSTTRMGSAPITLSTLTFQFKGCLSEIQLTHEAGQSETAFAKIALEETIAAPQKPRWAGSSNLTIHPGQTRVYSFAIIFREAGGVDAVASIFEINTDRFDLVCTHSDLDQETEDRPTWWLQSGSRVKPRKLKRGSGSAVKVLPKPPKMEIMLPDLRDSYYTDEPVTVAIEVLNKEEEDTEAVLEVRVLGRAKDALGYSWVGREASSPMKEVPPQDDDVDLPGHVVGHLAKGEKITEKITFNAPSEPSDYVLEVKVLYHLLSDRDIPISKTMHADLIFNAPFEATYDLVPRLHPEPWGSFFNVAEPDTKNNEANDSGAVASATGIIQAWQFSAKLASFAEDALIVRDLAVETHAIHGGATCKIDPEFESGDGEALEPQQVTTRSFNMETRKTTLEERRPTSLDLSLVITWQRSQSSSSAASEDESSSPAGVVTTILAVPRININASEPRVLASVSKPTSPDLPPELIIVTYTIENPTMHFLTFELNMEASEDFGFSGPKSKTLHVLPMSRQSVAFNVLPLAVAAETREAKEGRWVSPVLRVQDRYFNKSLKVQVADSGPGVRQGKKGVGIWVAGSDGNGPPAVEDV